MDARKEYNAVIDGLLDRLEYLSGAGVYHIPVKKADTDALRKEAVACAACGLGRGGKKAVAGAGSSGPLLMFVGGAPGSIEEKTGKPFSGEEGEQLSKIVKWMGGELKIDLADKTYYTYAVKCATEGADGAGEEEVAICKGLLEKEIGELSPRLIVILGAIASRSLLGSSELDGVRGRFQTVSGVKTIATYDPAALIKRPELKKAAMEDFKRVIEELRKNI